MAGSEGGLSTPEEIRDELKLTVDFIPDDKLTEALIFLDNLLVFNKETQEAIDDVMNNRNLLGPYYSAEEMIQAVLAGDDEDDDE
ncbi:MAG: hypothetical protein II877_11375 [Synergistaceae bacterium]|nr:hypothetical protein [Synergistaceae bacterium]MBR0258140.1 hypothetical protein [Synergistaceae bacterium]